MNFRRFRLAPSLLLGCSLALLLLLGVFCPAAHAETRMTNMWWSPEGATVGAHKIDALLMVIFNLTGIVFIVVQVVYIYLLVKYRQRPGVRAIYNHGNNRLEAIWTLIPAAIFIGLATYSNHLWKELRSPPKDFANGLQFDIVGHQFGWFIRNPGADGKLGASEQTLLTKENTFGTVPDDPAGNDDYASSELTIPVNRPINILLRSQDVIHGFYIPEFRMYQDAVPGRLINWVWFTPDKIGQYELACSQLCGAGHYNMKARLNVVSQADYDRLAAQKSKAAMEEKKQAQARQAAAAAAPVALANPVPNRPDR